MTVEGLSVGAAVILSLAFSYVPGLNVKFAALRAEYKQLIMLGLLAAFSGCALGLACLDPEGAKVLGLTVICVKSDIYKFVSVLVQAIIANQGVFMISPQTASVKAAKK